MKEKVFWLIIAALVVVTLLVSGLERPMAIDFEYASWPQKIDFGDFAPLKNLTQKTICAWIRPESLYDYQHIFDINAVSNFASTASIGGYQLLNQNGKIRFVAAFGTTEANIGAWDSAAVISAGAENLVCVTYDNSSTSNDPVLYINGASTAVTEVQAPSGSLLDAATGGVTKIGLGLTAGIGDIQATQFDGIIRDVRVYNRILTAAEIATIYSARGRDNIRNGLVFCPLLHGAKGLQAFDGATIGATNLIVDPCSGSTGTPSGNPVGVGETYLMVR